MFTDSITSETLTIDGPDTTGEIKLTLTEAGEITSSVTGYIPAPEPATDSLAQLAGNTAPQYHDFHGEALDGTGAMITGAVTESDYTDSSDGSLTDIRPASATFNSAPDTPFVDQSVTIKFDMLNFRAPKYIFPQPDDLPLLTRDGLTFHSDRLSDFDDRLNLIKEYRRSLRTGTITLTQAVNGPVDRQLNKALSSLRPVTWLLAFVQGVYPAPIRARITEVDDDSIAWTYERWMTTWRNDIGNAFTERIDWANDARVFLDDAYDRFDDRADDYRYRRCISWYLDALLDRTIDCRVASIAAGIEILAERYAAYSDGPVDSDGESEYENSRVFRVSEVLRDVLACLRNVADENESFESNREKDDDSKGKTAARIQHLVQELNVNVDDLVEFSESFDSNPGAVDEYFYATTRNFVLHNARDEHPFDSVFTDYEASLTLFRRILFKELTGCVEHNRYTGLSDLMPTDQRFE